MTPSASTVTRLSAGMIAAFAAIYFFWGTTYLGIALAIQTIPPFITGASRFLLAGLVMYMWLRWRNPRPFENVNLPVAALAGVLLSGMGNGLVTWSQQGIPSGIAALVVTAVPVIVLLLDWAFFSKRPPSRPALIGTAIAFSGVVAIVTHTRSLSGDAQPLYLIALIASTFAWSFGTLIQKRSATPDTVLSFTCAQMFFTAVSWKSVLAVGYLVVAGSIIGLNCYLWLLTRVSAAKVATYALVNPVVALFLGTLVLGERLTALALIAAAMVLVGVGLVLFQDAKWLNSLRRRETPQAGAVASSRSR
jgi:drug/metabolite transporter (DMT)-like permease